MAAQGRKRTLYVGGLEDSVTEEIVFAAFVPFGDLKEVSLPKDFGDKTKSMNAKQTTLDTSIEIRMSRRLNQVAIRDFSKLTLP